MDFSSFKPAPSDVKRRYGSSSDKEATKSKHPATEPNRLKHLAKPTPPQPNRIASTHTLVPRNWTRDISKAKVEHLVVAAFAQGSNTSNTSNMQITTSSARFREESELSLEQNQQRNSTLQNWLDTPVRDHPYENIGSVVASDSNGRQEDADLVDEDQGEDQGEDWWSNAYCEPRS